MYLEHYGLKEKPFQISTDPKFLWLGEKHKEALATLKYGILDNKGFLLLTGDVGTGKTTLINSLLENLEDQVIVVTVPDPGLEKLDFFNYISQKLAIKKHMATKGDFLVYFSHFLHNAYNNGKKVLLIIDEAQQASQELLEEIRLLSNIEKQDTKLINIFFIGQNEFNDILWSNKNRAIRQRMTLNYNLKPLTEKEICEYIRHRLKVAGTSKKIFTSAAIHEIFLFSGGYPRKINIICDHALLSGFVKEVTSVTGEIVNECANELKIPEFKPRTETEEKDSVIDELKKEIEEIREFTIFNAEPDVPDNEMNDTDISPFFETLGRPKKSLWLKLGLAFVFVCLFAGIIALSYFRWFGDTTGGHYRIKPPSTTAITGKQTITESMSTAGLTEKQNVQAESPGKDQVSHDDGIREFPITDKKPAVGSKVGNQSLEEEDLSGDGNIKARPLVEFPEQVLVISFDHDSTALSVAAIKALDDFAVRIKAFPEAKISITGFTDESGNQGYNESLASFRAMGVKTYLIGKGIPRDYIEAVGRGGEDAQGTGRNGVAPSVQRRVEIQAFRE